MAIKSDTKYIFVMGGVLSGLGKGIAVSSIAKLLQSKGYRVTAMKIDPYVNVDAGTMNPIEHGEVFVTADGLETDQDIGNYERFLNTELTRINYMTTGQVYLSVIKKERNLEYGGKCVEVVPHIPEEVIRRIVKVGNKTKANFVLIEIGGTVGEYQNLIFLEAARMMHLKKKGCVQFILVSYFPIPSKLGEMKTKPTQYAIRTLNSAGIQPDFILGRSERPLDMPRRETLSNNCNIDTKDIISAPDVDNIYKIPLILEKQKLAERILAKFGIKAKKTDLNEWNKIVRTAEKSQRKVKIAIVGKYFTTGNYTLVDSYISVIEAVKHAAWANKVTPEFHWVESEAYEKKTSQIKELLDYDGIIVPQGWGSRGSEGKIKAIQYARIHKIPYFGLCYGMQMAVVEFARHVAGLKNANSLEINPKTPYPVIHIMPEQEKYLQKKQYGGTIRLGDWPCRLVKGTRVRQAYGKQLVQERHRHRYEFNLQYQDKLTKKGLVISGTSPDKKLIETIELSDHPFFMGTQFHPEYKSCPENPHPLFVAFIKASLKPNKVRNK